MYIIRNDDNSDLSYLGSLGWSPAEHPTLSYIHTLKPTPAYNPLPRTLVDYNNKQPKVTIPAGVDVKVMDWETVKFRDDPGLVVWLKAYYPSMVWIECSLVDQGYFKGYRKKLEEAIYNWNLIKAGSTREAKTKIPKPNTPGSNAPSGNVPSGNAPGGNAPGGNAPGEPVLDAAVVGTPKPTNWWLIGGIGGALLLMVGIIALTGKKKPVAAGLPH